MLSWLIRMGIVFVLLIRVDGAEWLGAAEGSARFVCEQACWAYHGLEMGMLFAYEPAAGVVEELEEIMNSVSNYMDCG